MQSVLKLLDGLLIKKSERGYNMKKFALIGAAGFVAPRHIEAIHATGNDLVVALDPHDSVGRLDKYFPDCFFFTEVERFDRYLEKLRRSGDGVDYISVCSPNYLHDAHCRLAMRVDANVICEKPVVIRPWNIDQLVEIEKETGKKVNVVLQLRLYPELIALKKKFEITNKMHNVVINYVTPRGRWYHESWKGDEGRSGGLVINIGVHLFDLVTWLFGNVKIVDVVENKRDKISGNLLLESASVEWSLSTDRADLPEGSPVSHRLITIDGEPLKFDNVFTSLHTEVYKDVLSGGGFTLEDARPAIEIVHKLRSKMK